MKRTRAPLFGDDVFISYKRSDAAEYALALASELTKHELSCFLDQWGTPPGAELPEPLRRRIRKSGLFVLVGTAGAAISEPVRQEVEEFLKTGRAIIPITFPDEGSPDKGSLARASWFKSIEGLALAKESAEALQAGRPADSVIDRIVNAEGFTSRNRRLRRSFWVTCS